MQKSDYQIFKKKNSKSQRSLIIVKMREILEKRIQAEL